MRNQRSFSLEFKRQVVEELMSGESDPAQLCRRHNITPSLLYHWKKQYSRGKFNNEPTEEGALRDRVEKLERLVCKLTLENEEVNKPLLLATKRMLEELEAIFKEISGSHSNNEGHSDIASRGILSVS